MSDFARFRSGHGVRPQDAWTGAPWHHLSDTETPPADVRAVSLRNLSAERLAALPPSTEAIYLGWCPDLNGASLLSLAHLPRLRWLYIDHPHHLWLEAAALAVLAVLPLEVLALRARPGDAAEAGLGTDALAALAGHPTLRFLALCGLSHLPALHTADTLPALETLDLTDTPAPTSWPALPNLQSLYLDGPLPLPSPLCLPGGLDTLSLCARRWPRESTMTAPLAARRVVLWDARRLPAWETLLHADTVVLDLAGLPPPPSAVLAAHLPGLRALRLGVAGLRGAHLAALPPLEALWLGAGGEGDAHRLKPGDWAALAHIRLARLTLDGPSWGAAHLAAIATHGADTLRELVVFSGASALRAPEAAAALAPLAGRGVAVHLDGASDEVIAAVRDRLGEAPHP